MRGLAGALLVAGFVILARSHGWLQPVELLAYDKLRVAWSPPAASDRVLLVGLTDADIQRWQRYPITDEALAELLERIASWHPRAIGVDIYRDFPQPPGTEKLDAVVKAHPEIYWVFKLADPGVPYSGVEPLRVLKGTAQVALADVPPDAGNVARRGLLYADDGKDTYTGMGLALALRYLAARKIAPEAGPDDSLKLGKSVIPPLDETHGPYVKLDAGGYQILLDYHGGASPFRRVSIGEAMEKDESALVRDKVVLIGDTSISVKDSFETPFSTGFSSAPADYGMEIHAHLADQLIRLALYGDTVLTGLSRRSEDLWILAWALAGGILGLVIRKAGPAVAAGGVGLVAIGGTVYAAFGYGLYLPAIPAMLAWGGAAGLTNQVLYAAANRARARLRQSFEHYLPPVVISEMLKADALPRLGGERREIAVLFTDIAGFTTFSESVDPVELAELTNEYFEGVCAAIFKHGGLVNAYIGDSVLAFFGAPTDQPDRADRAIGAALDIDRFTTGFKDELAARGIEFGHTRIGLHTGAAFLGNIGTKSRLQYTALGDMLNTGSRLEGLNKAIGTHICCSAEIVGRAERYHCRKIGSFVVKGRSGATDVFTPVDPETPAEWEERYAEAFLAAEAEAPQAAGLFAAMYRERPEDACVAFHHNRLAAGELGTHVHMDEK